MVDTVVTNMLILGTLAWGSGMAEGLFVTPYSQCPGEVTGQRGPVGPPSQMNIHISPIIIILGFLAGGEWTLML